MSENEVPSGLNRRSVVKGAAWSVPVIAAAVAAPAASASHSPGHGKDLTPIFRGEQVLNFRLGTPPLVSSVSATLATRLSISNIGDLPSVPGEIVTVSYPGTLGSFVRLASLSGFADVSAAPNGFLITLPAIPAGFGEEFALELVGLPEGILAGPQTIVATVIADDADSTNNRTTSDVGITLLANSGPRA